MSDEIKNDLNSRNVDIPAVNIESYNSGCFVATATLGDSNHPIIYDLRFYRDNYLRKRNWGRVFIKQYYTYSPFLANIIKRNNILRKLCLYLLIKPIHTRITKK